MTIHSGIFYIFFNTNEEHRERSNASCLVASSNLPAVATLSGVKVGTWISGSNYVYAQSLFRLNFGYHPIGYQPTRPKGSRIVNILAMDSLASSGTIGHRSDMFIGSAFDPYGWVSGDPSDANYYSNGAHVASWTCDGGGSHFVPWSILDKQTIIDWMNAKLIEAETSSTLVYGDIWVAPYDLLLGSCSNNGNTNTINKFRLLYALYVPGGGITLGTLF